MAWTLLSASLQSSETLARAEPRESAPPDAPAIEQAASPTSGDAWVLAGGLVRALEQTGMAEALLEAAVVPAAIYGWGLSTAPAVLAAGGDPRALRRGWEHLRAERFVAAALLGRRRWLAAVARAPRIGVALHSHLADMRGDVAVRLRVEGRFLPIADGTLASVLDSAIHADTRVPATLAAALAEAAARGCERILVLARHEREASHAEVAAAVAGARAGGCEVSFIAPVGDPSPPSALELLLPGCGRVERLLAGGSAAAGRWLESPRRAAVR